MDNADRTPDERDSARAEIEDEIRQYEDYLGTVASDLAVQSDPVVHDDPIIFNAEMWDYLVQLHADARGYVDYLNQLNDQLNNL